LKFHFIIIIIIISMVKLILNKRIQFECMYKISLIIKYSFKYIYIYTKKKKKKKTNINFNFTYKNIINFYINI